MSIPVLLPLVKVLNDPFQGSQSGEKSIMSLHNASVGGVNVFHQTVVVSSNPLNRGGVIIEADLGRGAAVVMNVLLSLKDALDICGFTLTPVLYLLQ